MQENTSNGAGESRSERLEAVQPRRIVIVRAVPGLGDFLCCVPAWRALRAAFPQSTITLLGLPVIEPLVRRFASYLDDYLEFPGFPGIAERPPAVQVFPTFLQQVQAQPFDLALQMHGSGGVSNLFTVLLGAHRIAGFYLPGQYCPDPELFLRYPDHLPEVQRHLALVRSLGIPSQGEHLEFPLLQADREAYGALRERYELTAGRFVCIHPGASDQMRRWPAPYFAAVGDFLAEKGFRVVLTGTAKEATITRAVANYMRQAPVDLAGKTDVGTLAMLLNEARLLVCNDTGVSHLAAATYTPSVVLFIASEPERWAPLDRQRHRVISGKQNTSGNHAMVNDNSKAQPGAQITPQFVLREVEAHLQKGWETSYAG